MAHELVHAWNYWYCLDVTTNLGRAQTEHAAYSYSALFATKMGWSGLANKLTSLSKENRFIPAILDPKYNYFNLPFHPFPN